MGDISDPILTKTNFVTIPDAAPNATDPSSDAKTRNQVSQAPPPSVHMSSWQLMLACSDGSGGVQALTATIWIYVNAAPAGKKWVSIKSGVAIAPGAAVFIDGIPNQAKVFVQVTAATNAEFLGGWWVTR